MENMKVMKLKFNRILIIFITILSISILGGCFSRLSTDLNSSSSTVLNNIQEPTPTITQTPAVTPANTPLQSAIPAPTSVPTPIPTQKGPKPIPILYYHAVNDDVWGIEELFVSPKEFEKQMEFLKQNNYTVISFDQIPSASSFEKPIIITFDDGYEDNYTYMYPILKKYNYKATIFLVNDYIDKSVYLKKHQILEMNDLISFQGHTITHPYLTTLKDADVENELAHSKILIENITGKKVNVLAYPIGDYNQRILEITRKHYTYAVLNGGGMYYTGDNNLEMKRIYVPRNLTIQGFEAKIKATK